MEKQKLINQLRKEISAVNLPTEIQLERWAKITDVKKFFNSHLQIIETQKNQRIIEPVSERLKKALMIVGIDIKLVAKSIKNQK